jgi:dihydroorotase
MYCDHASTLVPRRKNIGALFAARALARVAGVKAFLGSSTGSLLLDKRGSDPRGAEGGEPPHIRAFRR